MSERVDKVYEVLVSSDGYNLQRHADKLVVKYGTVVDILGDAFEIFSKYVKVFDLYFVATSAAPDYKVLHGASVLYQYIDNTDSGTPDNPLAYSKLKENKCTMVMFKDQDELQAHIDFFDNVADDIIVQDLEADETRPGSLFPYAFDESLEECFHLVTHGHVLAYPETFGSKHGSSVTYMMDSARGGFFENVPAKYPPNAWYTYYADITYEGFLWEYLYWAMTTILGAQRYRHCEIKNEWRPYTRADIQTIDNPIYTLLTDPKYKLPTKLPSPVAGMPLYIRSVGTCNDSKNEKAACCGCFGKYQNKIKKFILRKR